MRVQSKGDARYFVTFVDDCTRWCEIYLLKQKSDVLNAFKEFKAYAENQCGERIKYLQSDNGREYCNGEFDDFLKEQGIRRRLTVPHTPQQNDVAERKNRTLIEMACCILFQADLQMSFWAEAVHAVNYLRNRCASRSLEGRTPYEKWIGKTPDLRHLRVIGTGWGKIIGQAFASRFYSSRSPTLHHKHGAAKLTQGHFQCQIFLLA